MITMNRISAFTAAAAMVLSMSSAPAFARGPVPDPAVKEFQRSPSTEEALIILAQSYDKLGMIELRDDAVRVLQTNFPSATMNVDLMGRRKTPWWQLW